ncbi:5'-methylthioadenosine/adenosylhomocysteine nucleosidase [Sedimentibacter sp. MB31-C6]|uniref:5'-methylthioadenosine/adenosylhomocysteine nucleosidase n=1 Tax=Sedimentibacter sp. MB31-C6 TaxID=3109366 RepID=UPI002DDCE116|nr:5'-methylthioadenosine/adenosylhomocysteine nucleosidase [Sedimentibacter sp. MB36-C1]WSI02959.1 5'-methylthioadenosine/adenosylhomocysteine nucleosidase [Sedimentibacter sp. MB36-C1]
MKIGIIGAMDVEIAEIKDSMKNITQEKISSVTYFQGTIHDKEVIVAKCGIGKVHAAVCAQTMILRYSPNVIINTGVAGSLNNKLDIGDLVISDYVVQHDFDTSGVGDPIGLISGLNLIKIPCKKSLVEKIKDAANNIENTNVYVGTIASGDQFICNTKQKDYIINHFDALCAEMEGAAIGHVCYLNNIDFCIVRAMSDKADGSANMDFPVFVQRAAKKSIELIDNYLKMI